MSMEMKAKDKITIMEAEYGIPVENDIREEVNIMCNLGEGLAENYMKQGIEEGKEQIKKSVILNMYADGVSMENIIKWAGADENLVKAVIAEYKESRA